MYTQRLLGHMTLVIGLIIGMPRSVSACTSNTYLSDYGFDEAKFKCGLQQQQAMTYTQDAMGLMQFIPTLSSAHMLSGGRFEPMTLATLRNKTVPACAFVGSMWLLMGDPADLGKLDVGYLQSRSKNSGATFQVASNFDCLEGVNKAESLDIGLYPTDNTQGPRAAFSAFPGAFVRKYLLKDKVNLLDDALDQVFKNTGLKPSVACGYLDLSTFTPAQLAQINKNFDQALVKVGVHEKVHVVYGANWTDAPEATNILINQVFTAALDLGTCSGSDNWKVAGNKDVQEIAQKLLNAAYEGTIRAAQIMGSKRLYLTLVGGGVFENKLEHIAAALESCSQVIKDSGVQVMLVIFDGSKLDKQLHKRLSKLVKTILQDVVK